MSHRIDELYDIMFNTLKALQDKDNPMETDRAKAITSAVDTTVNIAKVEIDHMRLTGGHGSGFIPVQSIDRNRAQLPGETYSEKTGNGSNTVTTLANGATVTRHRMGG